MAKVSKQFQVLCFLDRPREPIIVPKSEMKISFTSENTEFLAEKYQSLGREPSSRFGGSEVRVELKKVDKFPDISFSMNLSRTDDFSLFVPCHRDMADKLIDIFLKQATFEDFQAVSGYARDRVNPFMFVYTYCVTVLHRPDTRGLQLPPLTEMFPDKFVDGGVFGEARVTSNVSKDSKTRRHIEIPKDYTASDLEEEHRVAYFREDLGVNLHHWHWHLVYPGSGNMAVVNKDRRGELFYYMHQQIIARYNFERLCNRLGRVVRLLNWRDPIPEGYFSKLNTMVATRNYASRPAGSVLKNLNREKENVRIDIADLERWRDRIYEAIHLNRVVNKEGVIVRLDNEAGIDHLGNIVEASDLSINADLYGNLHIMGHFLLSMLHDPDERHLETFGVMGDVATALRDPVFYRWHAFIDDLFQTHKVKLPSYTADELDYQDIRIADFEVKTTDAAKNELTTYWQKNDLDLSRGMDFLKRGSVFARLTQLQHTPFTYRIQVHNKSNIRRRGTARIFLAPKFDERGQTMKFKDQRLLFIEMDKFEVTMDPNSTEISRESTKSSVTIPFETSFRDLEKGRPTAVAGGALEEGFNFCGCGWPQHMLLPKGSPEGFPCQLFVMISDIKGDTVEGSEPSNSKCVEASSFCGIRDRKYPDRRPMGFPFDRVLPEEFNTLQSFLTPNMMVIDVRIVFTNRTKLGKIVSNHVTETEV